jgi:hypothetical protein
MSTYVIPDMRTPVPAASDEVLLVANGDLRQSANQQCWAAQANLEKMLSDVFAAEGIRLRRAHPYDPQLGHGFIYSPRMGMKVFENIHPDAPLVVAESVWQYSSHLLAGLFSHRGPILVVANWSGEWPGLVGMLNLKGACARLGFDSARYGARTSPTHSFWKGCASGYGRRRSPMICRTCAPWNPSPLEPTNGRWEWPSPAIYASGKL